jgi:hypothetical protein
VISEKPRGFGAICWDLIGNIIYFFYWKMCGPIPRACGPGVLSVHHGPAPLLHLKLLRSSASGRSGARGHRLTVQGGGRGFGEPFGGLT